MEKETEVIPFSNSSEFAGWFNANCEKCKKYQVVDESGFSTCEIENSVFDALIGVGMQPDMISRMGGTQDSTHPMSYNFAKNCTELDPV